MSEVDDYEAIRSRQIKLARYVNSVAGSIYSLERLNGLSLDARRCISAMYEDLELACRMYTDNFEDMEVLLASVVP